MNHSSSVFRASRHFAIAACVLFTSFGCGSEPTTSSSAATNVDELNSRVEKAEDAAKAAQQELKTTQKNARLLAQQIKTLSNEKDTLEIERDVLRQKVNQAGEKFAAVQTQFSELRARSAEFNSALETLEGIISNNDPNNTGIAINPRDEKATEATAENADTNVEVNPGTYAKPESN